jgi:hypothetical protein
MPADFVIRSTGDQNKLVDFLEDTRDFLDKLVNEEPNRFFVDQLRPAMKAAWKKAKRRFADAIATARSFAQSRLDAHGLSDEELSFKLAVVRYHFDRFMRLQEWSPLKRFIEAIDHLLESILEAAGIGSAISEIKDAIGLAIDES